MRATARLEYPDARATPPGRDPGCRQDLGNIGQADPEIALEHMRLVRFGAGLARSFCPFDRVGQQDLVNEYGVTERLSQHSVYVLDGARGGPRRPGRRLRPARGGRAS